jgi:hypothetical protein
VFVVEDERHAEIQGEFGSRGEAIAELRRRSRIPWNEHPNVAPCTNWEMCGRDYELIEYDDSGPSWREVAREKILEVSAAGVHWFSLQE